MGVFDTNLKVEGLKGTFQRTWTVLKYWIEVDY